MKKCPFCAEDIQDEAIKCKHCGSFLSQAPAPGGAAAAPRAAANPAGAAAAPAAAPAPAGPAPAPAPAATPAPASMDHVPPPMRRAAGAPPDDDRIDHRTERKTVYEGVPSWKAYIGNYVLGVIGTVLVPVIFNWLAVEFGMTGLNHALMILIPLGMAAIYFAVLHLYRRSFRFRVTTTNIETEHGVLARKIDVLPLWRCRDIRYKQNLIDRILGIAHVELFTADMMTPHLEIKGMPASRALFESIRDSIEVQRQAKNVYGVIS